MICNNCHSELPDGSAFCNNCGAGLAPQQPREVPAYKASNYIEAYDQQQEVPAYKASSYAEAYVQQQQNRPYSAIAITAFVLGVVSIATSFLPIINNFSFFIALAGTVLALVGIFTTGKKRRGTAFTVVGLVLSFAAIGIILLTQSMYVGAINSLTDGAKPVEASVQAESPKSTESSKASGAAKDFSKMAVGDSVTLENGLTVTVMDAQVVTQEYTNDKQMRVTVSYLNNGDSSVSYNLWDWKSENADGVERSIEFPIGDDNSLDSGKLKPGGTITGNVYFEDDVTKVYYYSNILQGESNVCWIIQQ